MAMDGEHLLLFILTVLLELLIFFQFLGHSLFPMSYISLIP